MMKLFPISAILCFSILPLYAQTTLTTDDKTYDINKVPEIILPKNITVNTDKRSRITVTLVSGGRQVWLKKIRPNIETHLNNGIRATKMVIKIENSNGMKTHIIDIKRSQAKTAD